MLSYKDCEPDPELEQALRYHDQRAVARLILERYVHLLPHAELVREWMQRVVAGADRQLVRQRGRGGDKRPAEVLAALQAGVCRATATGGVLARSGAATGRSPPVGRQARPSWLATR
jgi:hypothetical protein